MGVTIGTNRSGYIGNFWAKSDGKYKYRIVTEGDICFVVSSEESLCPICGGVLSRRGSVKRGVIMPDGKKKIYILRRNFCGKCKKTHRELPDFITPYKRHCAETIENVINGNGDLTPCEDSTISRIRAWWCRLLPYFSGVLLSLKIKHGIAFPAPAPFNVIVRAVVNSHNWRCTCSACLSP